MGDTSKQAIHLLFFETMLLGSAGLELGNLLVFAPSRLGFQSHATSA